MLKIRLQRVGRRNNPSFRVVVVDSRQSISSNKSVEQVGFYNPKQKERALDAERISYWIENGAQPSDTVHNLLIKEGVIKGETRNVLPQKSPVKKEGDDEKVETGGSEESARESDDPAKENEKTSVEEGDDTAADSDEKTEETPEESTEKEEKEDVSKETTEEKQEDKEDEVEKE